MNSILPVKDFPRHENGQEDRGVTNRLGKENKKPPKLPAGKSSSTSNSKKYDKTMLAKTENEMEILSCCENGCYR